MIMEYTKVEYCNMCRNSECIIMDDTVTQTLHFTLQQCLRERGSVTSKVLVDAAHPDCTQKSQLDPYLQLWSKRHGEAPAIMHKTWKHPN
jgi:hypothetical protein